MKLIMAIGGSGLMVGGLYASDALTPGEVYDLPPAQVRSELAAMPLPADLLIVAGGSDSAAVEMDHGASWVRWQISSGGRTVSRFTADMSSEMPGKTRVTLKHERLESGDDWGLRLSATDFIRGYTNSSFAEQVDARLERRAFDHTRVMQAFAEHHSRHPEDVQELGLVIGEMFNEVSNEAAFVADNGALEPDVRSRMQAATRPSIELPTQN